jgi:hypothetical protein
MPEYDDDRRPRRLRPGAIAAGLVAIGVIGMWAYVFGYHLSGQWRQDTPGRLDDRSFGATADEICTEANARLGALPPAWETSSPEARADAVDASVPIFEDMIAELQNVPTGGDDTVRVNEWLSDWRTYVGDRAAYAERLRSDPNTRFYVTQSDRDNRQITMAVDRFATTNQMPSCVTPSDLS